MSHCQPECGVDPCNNPPPVDAANETLESTVNNFITEFFGTVTKSVVDNRVVWALPCDLDTGLPGFPRTENVGLACYFLDLFVDLAAQVASGGILPQLAVRQATTANITLSGEQTIDGVLTSASRVLVKNQTLSKNNGIYVTGAGAWTRATDADIVAELQVKNYYFVTNGTTQGGTGWTITTAPVVLGTDPIVFTQFNALSSYTAGSGLSLAGTVFSLDTSIAMLRSANLSDLANKVTAQINLLPNQLGHAGEALLTDGVNVSWGPVATADSTARSKADSAALVASAATSQNVAQSSLISTNTVAVSTADSKAVAASTADSSNLATSNSQNTSQSVLISTATSAAAVADSKAASNSTLISSNTVAISVADSKAVSDSVVISTNLATTGSQNTSQSTLISTADSKATSVAAGGTTTDSTARSMATSVATVEASDNTAAQSRDTSQSVLISTATANASVADSKAVSDSAVISTNLSLGSSQNTSQSTLISTADSKAVSATGNSVDSIARSQATSVATVESTDASTAVSRDLSQSTLISVADSKGTSAAGNSNDSIARSQATSVATTESADYSASNSKDVSQSVLVSVATINASAADSKAVSVSLVVSANLATANAQDTTQSTNISATDSRATSAASLDASANTSQSLLISTATSAAATADSKAVSDSVVISTNLATTGSQNTSQSVLISTATTAASAADSKAVSDSVVISTNLATTGSQNTSQSVLISTATTAASTADSKAVSDSVGMSVTDSKATSLSTGFSAANSQALVDSASISGGTSSLTSSDVSQSVLISTATSKADSASGNSNDSVARSMATSAATLAGSQNNSQSTLVSTATTNASTADSKAVAVSTADSSNLVTSNSQNTSQSVLISTATSAAATADSKALSDSVVISSNLQTGNSQNTSQSVLLSATDSRALSDATHLAGAITPTTVTATGNVAGAAFKLPIQGTDTPQFANDASNTYIDFNGTLKFRRIFGGAASDVASIDTNGAAIFKTIALDTSADLRTSKTNLKLTLNVKDFDAVGDGSTDDSTAIANAFIAARATGGIDRVIITALGTGYTSAPTVAFTGGFGSGQTATALVADTGASGEIGTVVVTAPGTGHKTVGKQCGLTSGSSVITCSDTSGLVTGISAQHASIPNGTTISSISPNVSITLSANASASVTFAQVAFGIPFVTFSGGGGSGATADAILGTFAEVLFPPGEYKFGGLELTGFHNLVVNGYGANLLVSNANSSGFVIDEFSRHVSVNGLLVKHLSTVFGNSAPRGTGCGMRVAGSFITIKDCAAQNSGEFGIIFGRDRTTGSASYGCRLINFRALQTCGDGIHVSNGCGFLEIISPVTIGTGDDAIGIVADYGTGNEPSNISVNDYNLSGGGWRAFAILGAKNVQIGAGIIRDFEGYGIEVGVGGGTASCTDISIANFHIRNIGAGGAGSVTTLRHAIVFSNCTGGKLGPGYINTATGYGYYADVVTDLQIDGVMVLNAALGDFAYGGGTKTRLSHLYRASGALTYRGNGGTVTTIANS